MGKKSNPGMMGKLGFQPNEVKPLSGKVPGLSDAIGNMSKPPPAIPDMADQALVARGLFGRYRAMMGGSRRESFVTGQSASSILGGGAPL